MKTYKWLLLFLLLFIYPLNSFAANNYYGCTALIGGTSGALDSLDITGASSPNEDNLVENDVASVWTISGTTVKVYHYIFDASGTEAENSPYVIRPDDYATAGNWLLVDSTLNTLALFDGVAYSTTLQSDTLDSDITITLPSETMNLGNMITEGREGVIVPVRNTTGSEIAAGKIVYVSSSSSQYVNVSLADNTTLAYGQRVLYMHEALANNTTGEAYLLGRVTSQNTGSYDDGDALYLSTSGDMVTSEPGTGSVILLGFVEYANAGSGTVAFYPRYIELTETEIDHVKAMDQDLATTDDVEFNSVDTGSVTMTTAELGGTGVTDTTLSRSAAGVLAVEGIDVEMSNSNDIDPDRLAGDTTDDDKIDADILNITSMDIAIDYDLLDSDETYSGTPIDGIDAGEDIDPWEVVYYDTTATEWLLADADASGEWPSRGLLVDFDDEDSGEEGYAEDGDEAMILQYGLVRYDTWDWTPGGDIYLSDTAGGLTQTAPSTSDDCVQPVGVAITADIVLFDFGQGYGQVE